MVKVLISLCLAGVLVLGWFTVDRRLRLQREEVEFNLVDSAMIGMSLDLTPILADKAVTNLLQLKREYQNRYPARAPLFSTRTNFPAVMKEEHTLPLRNYYCLPWWDWQDPPSTPLLWSHFRLRKGKEVVLYLTLTGEDRGCSLDEFRTLIGPLSNRVEALETRCLP